METTVGHPKVPLRRLSHVYPRGGPKEGGTALTAWGSGFKDLGHGTHADGTAGLYCRFGQSDLVPAVRLNHNDPS